MKFMKNWKRFWTLNAHHDAGFTLVELIVVIAILAILATVAVPAYSGYVKKANMQADQTLVSEVANALLLHYYSNPGEVVSGYVVLTTTGAFGDGGFGDAAMLAVFGEGWDREGNDAVSLRYDGWEPDNIFVPAEEAAIVAQSSYFQSKEPSELVESFSLLTDALAGMASTASQDPLTTMANIPGFMTEAEITSLRGQLEDIGVSWDDDKEAYATAVSNLLIQNTSVEIGDINNYGSYSGLSNLAWQYAMLYGWASSKEEGSATLDSLNAVLTAEGTNSQEVVNAVNTAFESAQDDPSFGAYMMDGDFEIDTVALASIMGTVSDWSASADMTTSGLYSSDSIADAVNNYAVAVDVVNGLTDEQLARWETLMQSCDGIIVFLTPNGETHCTIPTK